MADNPMKSDGGLEDDTSGDFHEDPSSQPVEQQQHGTMEALPHLNTHNERGAVPKWVSTEALQSRSYIFLYFKNKSAEEDFLRFATQTRNNRVALTLMAIVFLVMLSASAITIGQEHGQTTNLPIAVLHLLCIIATVYNVFRTRKYNRRVASEARECDGERPFLSSDREEEVFLARLWDVIGLCWCGVSSILYSMTSYPNIRVCREYANTTSLETDDEVFERCIAIVFAFPMHFLALSIHLQSPRAFALLIMAVLSPVSMFLMSITAPEDTREVLGAKIVMNFVVYFSIVVLKYNYERGLRSNFTAFLTLHEAIITLTEQTDSQEKYFDSLVPPVLRNRLSGGGLLEIAPMATCIVVDIYDFSRIVTTRLTPEAAVFILSTFHSNIFNRYCGKTEDDPGVHRIVSTGDTFYGVCNLLSKNKTPEMDSLLFASRILSRECKLLSDAARCEIPLRVSIATGRLLGIVGTGFSAVRYDLFGEALLECKRNIQVLTTGGIVVDTTTYVRIAEGTDGMINHQYQKNDNNADATNVDICADEWWMAFPVPPTFQRVASGPDDCSHAYRLLAPGEKCTESESPASVGSFSSSSIVFPEGTFFFNSSSGSGNSGSQLISAMKAASGEKKDYYDVGWDQSQQTIITSVETTNTALSVNHDAGCCYARFENEDQQETFETTRGKALLKLLSGTFACLALISVAMIATHFGQGAYNGTSLQGIGCGVLAVTCVICILVSYFSRSMSTTFTPSSVSHVLLLSGSTITPLGLFFGAALLRPSVASNDQDYLWMLWIYAFPFVPILSTSLLRFLIPIGTFVLYMVSHLLNGGSMFIFVVFSVVGPLILVLFLARLLLTHQRDKYIGDVLLRSKHERIELNNKLREEVIETSIPSCFRGACLQLASKSTDHPSESFGIQQELVLIFVRLEAFDNSKFLKGKSPVEVYSIVTRLFSIVENCRKGLDRLHRGRTIGDVVMVFGGLLIEESATPKDHEAVLHDAMLDAAEFMYRLCAKQLELLALANADPTNSTTTVDQVGLPLSIVGVVEETMCILYNTTFPTFDVIGISEQRAKAILAAAPRSTKVVTQKFHRHWEDTLTAARNLEGRRTIPPISFGGQTSWRIRGAGVMTLLGLTLE